LEVKLDGAPVGRVETAEQLRRGIDFPLPDGERLQLRLVRVLTGSELHVLRSGAPVPGSAGDPEQRVAEAAFALYFVATLSATLGLVAKLGKVEWLLGLGAGYGSIVGAVLYAGLAHRVKARHSRWALLLAIALYVIDGIATTYFAIVSSGVSAVGSLVLRLFFLSHMWRGLPALGRRARDPNSVGSNASVPVAPRPQARREQLVIVALAGLAIAFTVSVAAVAIMLLWPRALPIAWCKLEGSPHEIDACIVKEARRTRDIGLCGSMRFAHSTELCKIDVSLLVRQREECLAFEKGPARNQYVTNIVRATRNTALCELVEAGPSRQQCESVR
jgi:hypothetical protein